MDKILETVLKLGFIRSVPQFLFMDNVFHPSTYRVREEVYKFIESNSDVKEIDLIIESPGGSPDHAYRIIRTFRKNFETVNCIIPFWAKSAATLIALGGSTIIMDEFGEFGPLDAQIGKERDDRPEYDRKSALNDEHSLKIVEERYKETFESMFLRIYSHSKINIPRIDLSKQLFDNLSRFYEPLMSQINPYQLGEKRRSLDIGGTYAKRILAGFSRDQDEHTIKNFVHYLVHECPDHGFVIDKDILDLFELKNIYESHHFGKDYAQVLSELSTLLMDCPSYEYFVGFVIQQDNKSEEEAKKVIEESSPHKKQEKNTHDKPSRKKGTTKKTNNK